MKIVFLIRHASANHFEENIDDHEKGINKQGTLQSENIFKWIKKNDIKNAINFYGNCLYSSYLKKLL